MGGQANRERGAALIVVLWFSAAITVYLADLSAGRRETALEVAVVSARLSADIAADSALEIVVERLRRGTVDGDGHIEIDLGHSKVDAWVSPEGGRIDINGASEEMIDGLAAAVLEDPDAARALADRILDWRDDNRLRRSEGAEADDYRRAGLAHAPADGLFRYAGELRLLLDIEPDTARRLDELVTVATGNAEAPRAAASSDVARAVDLARGLSVVEPSEDEGDAVVEGEAPLFTTDDAGLYRIDIEAVAERGFTRRVRAIVWVDPQISGRAFEVLDHQAWRLPGPADDE